MRDQHARVRDHRVEDRGEDRVEVRAASESDRVAAVKQTRERPDITRRVPTELLDRLGQYRPPVWRPLPDQDEDTPPPADGPPPCNELEVEPRQCEDVAGRRITEDGMVIVDCADGSTWRTKPSGGDVFTTPDGISCRELELFALRKGTALPPAEPPSGMSAAQWAEQVNFWLSENVSHYLLFRIQSLVGDQYFDRYQSLEAEDAHNLYQRIDYRLAFLEKLMEQ